jgi:hypothetical protein
MATDRISEAQRGHSLEAILEPGASATTRAGSRRHRARDPGVARSGQSAAYGGGAWRGRSFRADSTSDWTVPVAGTLTTAERLRLIDGTETAAAASSRTCRTEARATGRSHSAR